MLLGLFLPQRLHNTETLAVVKPFSTRSSARSPLALRACRFGVRARSSPVLDRRAGVRKDYAPSGTITPNRGSGFARQLGDMGQTTLCLNFMTRDGRIRLESSSADDNRPVDWSDKQTPLGLLATLYYLVSTLDDRMTLIESKAHNARKNLKQNDHSGWDSQYLIDLFGSVNAAKLCVRRTKRSIEVTPGYLNLSVQLDGTSLNDPSIDQASVARIATALKQEFHISARLSGDESPQASVNDQTPNSAWFLNKLPEGYRRNSCSDRARSTLAFVPTGVPVSSLSALFIDNDSCGVKLEAIEVGHAKEGARAIINPRNYGNRAEHDFDSIVMVVKDRKILSDPQKLESNEITVPVSAHCIVILATHYAEPFFAERGRSIDKNWFLIEVASLVTEGAEIGYHFCVTSTRRSLRVECSADYTRDSKFEQCYIRPDDFSSIDSEVLNAMRAAAGRASKGFPASQSVLRAFEKGAFSNASWCVDSRPASKNRAYIVTGELKQQSNKKI